MARVYRYRDVVAIQTPFDAYYTPKQARAIAKQIFKCCRSIEYETFQRSKIKVVDVETSDMGTRYDDNDDRRK